MSKGYKKAIPRRKTVMDDKHDKVNDLSESRKLT